MQASEGGTTAIPDSIPPRLRRFVLVSLLSTFGLFVIYVAMATQVAIERQLVDSAGQMSLMLDQAASFKRYGERMAATAAQKPRRQADAARLSGGRIEAGGGNRHRPYTMLSTSASGFPPGFAEMAERLATQESLEWPDGVPLVTTYVVMDGATAALVFPADDESEPITDVGALSKLAERLHSTLQRAGASPIFLLDPGDPGPPGERRIYLAQRFAVAGSAPAQAGSVILSVGRKPLFAAGFLPSQLDRVSVYGPTGLPILQSKQLGDLRPIVRDASAAMGEKKPFDYRFEAGMLLVSTGYGALRVMIGTPISQVFGHDLARVALAFGLMLTALSMTWLGYRSYRDGVLRPAAEHLRRLQESEAFIGRVLSAAPAGIVVLGAQGGKALISNAMGESFMERPLAQADGALLREAIARRRPATGEHQEFAILDEGGSVRIILALVRDTLFQGGEALLCTLVDITDRKQAEAAVQAAAQEADEARAQAESANLAKSTFLSTMSHEIRTPLHGMLGTLEIMARSQLPEPQRQRLGIAQQSARMLLAVIDDVLDLSRIEAGEQSLERKAFDPVSLIESLVAGYASLAQQKNIALQCCLQPAPVMRLVGDGARIRQIAANLVSNAIKFTSVGRVFVKLDLLSPDDGESPATVFFRLQVADSGAGIAPDAQARIFEPFVQAGQAGTIRGTGLGLPISRRLARLMGGDIDVVSSPGLGSSFIVELELPVESSTPPPTVLGGAVIAVRATDDDVRRNLLELARSHGARAFAQGDPVPPGSARGDIVLLISDDDVPAAGDDAYLATVQLDNTPAGRQSSGTRFGADPYSQADIVGALLRALGRAGEHVHADEPADRIEPLGLHVIVVEDHPISRDLLIDQLALIGCTAAAFKDAEDALAALPALAADAVLTDVGLPGMTGFELVQRIRAQGLAMPIIGMSANALSSDIERAMAAGMDAYLVKPVLLGALHDMLAQYAHPGSAAGRALIPQQATGRDGRSDRPWRDVLAEDLRQLLQAHAQNDREGIARQAHRIKGGFYSLDLLDGATLCGDIESANNAQDGAALQRAIEHLRAYAASASAPRTEKGRT
ncbi:ATP-binding protein [Uliginosibacterium sp. sgz301328]|uniref:hybrid sensor histidine kinase/response regulator n=1 Tax=Uliginosibacterium sp. sgz301328 TaxID=3243764 RepID=UPI00359E9B23